MSLLKTLKQAIPADHPLRLVWHKSKAFVAALRYGFPARRLVVIGITGTDGKTTTVGMVTHILHTSGLAVGSLSTAFLQIRGDLMPNATQKTSPSPFMIQKFLRRLVQEGCTHAVIECSSHGLTQGRTFFTWPQVAGITNISAEHLDYHGTMHEYIRAKSILFHMLRGTGTKVLNAEDETFGAYRMIPTAHTTLTCRHPAEAAVNHMRGDETLISISDAHVHPNGSTATLHYSKHKGHTEQHPLSLSVPGAYNLENAMTAIGCAMGTGVPLEQSIAALQSFHGIAGRLEQINEGQPFSVYIDFTVTPASYTRTLSTLKDMLAPGKRLLALAGSCGDRMREKRPIVGKILSDLADVVVITNEDPYTEDPEKIINEVWAGVDQGKTDAHRISDRREALEFILSYAKVGDIVILCGKGSDTTMMTGHGQIPWHERAIAAEMLRAR